LRAVWNDFLLAAGVGYDAATAVAPAALASTLEIANDLYLSPKTVETHIRNLFNKLEVTSRIEIARAIEQADRAAQDQQ